MVLNYILVGCPWDRLPDVHMLMIKYCSWKTLSYMLNEALVLQGGCLELRPIAGLNPLTEYLIIPFQYQSCLHWMRLSPQFPTVHPRNYDLWEVHICFHYEYKQSWFFHFFIVIFYWSQQFLIVVFYCLWYNFKYCFLSIKIDNTFQMIDQYKGYLHILQTNPPLMSL